MHECAALLASGLLLLFPGKPVATAEPTSDGARVENLAPPLPLPASVRRALSNRSVSVRREGRLSVRLWLASRIPQEEASSASGTRPGQRLKYRIRPGALIGVIHLLASWRDYKGQRIEAGVYALHYAVQPLMKEHVGVSEFRDFLLLIRPEESRPAGSDVAQLVAASQRVSGTGHPAVLGLLPVQGDEGLPRLVLKERGVRVLEVETGGLTLGLALTGEGLRSQDATLAPQRGVGYTAG